MTTTDRTPGAGSAQPAWQEFREQRDRGLAAPHGILAQVALHWIEPDAGPQSVGGVPGEWQVVGEDLQVSWPSEGADGHGGLHLLAHAPEVTAEHRDGRTWATVHGGGDLRLARFGEDVHVDVIRRGGRTGLRILDPSAPRRTGFTGVPTFPYDPSAVVTGTWSAQPAEVTVGSALPWLEQQLPSPGVATVELGGTRLELVITGESSIFFTDETSGATSADWRMVNAELDGDVIRIDFNYAVNFPSAFSAWATCPRPPSGNHLPVAIRAGERRVEQTQR